MFNNEKVNEKVVYGDNCLLSFEAEDISVKINKLKNLGVKIVYPLTKIKDNWALEFKDKEGNGVEIYSKV